MEQFTGSICNPQAAMSAIQLGKDAIDAKLPFSV
jgi:hypothetical protein